LSHISASKLRFSRKQVRPVAEPAVEVALQSEQ
jgi:hypothetical protein